MSSSSLARALHLNYRHRRKFITSLFGLTFLASVVTVSASAILPCPADRGRYADGAEAHGAAAAAAALSGKRGSAVIEKKPRRWIEETRPVPVSKPSPSNAQP
ncbi:hypothetical protein PYCCODRAFT_1470443 [Trametes coccinea BRFM310]|uniref:Uncharacterized protein n=1 Tax=Trametes coccinea (strain BRFM310) TaxID=1353009 RepID=A0A1Y2IDM0_TRAC3|nr:hypothetical protein PYCCODRAFT_1470443 [Trametes coccinea BRFM310]